MDRDDPLTKFFPGQEDVDLYAVLSLDSKASSDDIKKAYRRHALRYHPDKHAGSSEEARAEASTKFQQISYAYTVLSDDKRRSRYDNSGRTDEGLELQAGEDGWEAYFADMFDSVTKGKLDEMKKEYQGSEEEVADIKRAYLDTDSTIGEIMNHIPHSTFEDEARFVVLISQLIKDGELPKAKAWEKSVKDEKARLVRQKQAERESAEAEESAKELGVWDEFYGSGKTGKRKGKGKQADASAEDGEDYSALQALILKKNQDRGSSLLESLAAKYSNAEPKGRSGKGKKRANENEEGRTAGKKSKAAPSPPEIDEDEFQKLQQNLFGDKDKTGTHGIADRATKGRKAKRS